jgi:diacylglycerol kinase family enzyme
MSDKQARGLLIMNPKATTASEGTLDVLVGALSSELELRHEHTRYRGHAADLAEQAAVDGVDVVIAFGGDGTVNEVVTGLMAHGKGPEDRPGLAIVPGGSTNVFARALGLPNHAVEATGALLRLLRRGSASASGSATAGLGQTRLVSLGAARPDDEPEERYFTFSASLGFDAAVVGEVERLRAKGKKSTHALYIRSAVKEYVGRADRRNAPITAKTVDGSVLPELFMASLANTSPWTYLGHRPIIATPEAGFETDLDLFGLTTLSPMPFWQTAGRLFSGSPKLVNGRGAIVRHDLPELTLLANRPIPFQVDGEYLGPRERVTFRSVPAALRVFA